MEDLMANDGKMDPSESVSKNEMAGLGNEMPQSERTTVVREVSLKIPVAVFTAKRGYDWTQLPDFVAQDEADALFERVMSLLSNYCVDLSVHDIFKGVIYEGKFAFAFCLQKAEKWDQANRNANYCACAFVTNECLADVDFERLLDNEYFTIPNHNPTAVLDYVDIDYIDPVRNDWEPIIFDLKSGLKCDFDWGLIGPMLSEAGIVNSKWIFMRMFSRGESRFGCEFGQWKEECFPDRESAPRAEDENREEEDLSGGAGTIPEPHTPSIPVVSSSIGQEDGSFKTTENSSDKIEIEDLKHQVESLRREKEELHIKLETAEKKVENQRKTVALLQAECEDGKRKLFEMKNCQVMISKQLPEKHDDAYTVVHLILAALVGAVIVLLCVVLVYSYTGSTDARIDAEKMQGRDEMRGVK